MATKKEDDDKDLAVTERDDGTAVVGREDETKEPVDAVDDHDDDDGEDEGSTKVAEDGDGSDDAQAKVREARRAERARKRERNKAREAANARELQAARDQAAALAQRLAAIENRNVSTDMAQLDAAINNETQAVAYYRNQIAEATTRQDGATVAEATAKMIEAHGKSQQLAAVKNQITQSQRQRTTQPSQADPRVTRLASDWVAKNTWYDPQKGDDDSRIAFQLDLGVKQRGFTPDTPEYWQELDAQVAKYLPHRVKIAPRRTNGSPVDGSGREVGSGGGGGGGQYTLSADRVKALKDAGRWDDPAERAKAIKSYRQYDTNAAAAAKRG